MTTGRDRLREFLDAVLDEDNATLDAMAQDVHSSPFHFARQFSRNTGESPVAMRRRVLLERAAWQLSRGTPVTEAAFAAGYDSMEGFTRAFGRAYGHPPSRTPAGARTSWLPSANGIHFHPPMALWVESESRDRHDMDPTSLLLHHDLDDTRELLGFAAELDDDRYRRPRASHTVLEWDGSDDSIAAALHHVVWSKSVWLACLEGIDTPAPYGDDPATLLRHLDDLTPRWLGTIREIDRRGGWGDTLIDALCEPPESFVLGSVIAHVLTFAAHRRQLARGWLRAELPDHTTEIDSGDPILWLRKRG